MRLVKANFLVKEIRNKNPLKVLVRAYSDDEIVPNLLRGVDYVRHPRLNKVNRNNYIYFKKDLLLNYTASYNILCF